MSGSTTGILPSQVTDLSVDSIAAWLTQWLYWTRSTQSWG